MSKLIYSIIGLVFVLLIIFAFTNTTTVYVCYEGSVVEDNRNCPTLPVITVTQRDAERAADNFANAIARSKGDSYSRVNSFREESNFFIDGVFTNTRDGTINRLTFKVDGRTSRVECIEGCSYFEDEEVVLENESIVD